MGRPKGHRSPDYDEKRLALARRVFECIMRDAGTSLHAMAEHTGVSRPTLRHYFGDRDGAVRAALEAAATFGKPHLRVVSEMPAADARIALGDAVTYMIEGWSRHGVGQLHHVGLKVGLEDGPTGATYLDQILEPLLLAFERLIERLVEENALGPVPPRFGALRLVSPIAMALIHQEGLGGEGTRPLDVTGFAQHLVESFCRAHPPTSD